MRGIVPSGFLLIAVLVAAGAVQAEEQQPGAFDELCGSSTELPAAPAGEAPEPRTRILKLVRSVEKQSAEFVGSMWVARYSWHPLPSGTQQPVVGGGPAEEQKQSAIAEGERNLRKATDEVYTIAGSNAEHAKLRARLCNTLRAYRDLEMPRLVDTTFERILTQELTREIENRVTAHLEQSLGKRIEALERQNLSLRLELEKERESRDLP